MSGFENLKMKGEGLLYFGNTKSNPAFIERALVTAGVEKRKKRLKWLKKVGKKVWGEPKK